MRELVCQTGTRLCQESTRPREEIRAFRCDL